MQFINKHQSNTTILDVGCGTGLITRNLTGVVTGFDINAWNLERAKAHAPHATYIQGDCEDMTDIPSESMDFVVCTETLEHLPHPMKAITEIHRVLKQHAKAVVSVPSDSMIWKFRKYLTTTHPHAEPFHHNFTKSNFLDLLQPFKILELHNIVYGLTWLAVVQKP